jgi:hypothetical protein
MCYVLDGHDQGGEEQEQEQGVLDADAVTGVMNV